MPVPHTTEGSTTETIKDLLSHLIGFPTVSANHDINRTALAWIERQLDGLPLHFQRYEHNGSPSLVATTKRTKHPKLWLLGHTDVVTADPIAFKPIAKDGRLYGRGSHDMKGALAIFMALLQAWGPDLENLDLGLMITSDEECGGFDGVKWLIEEHGYSGDVVINPDSGASWEMEASAKGVMWWQLTSTGKTAHASRTWDGVNAIDEMTRFLEVLRRNVPAEPCGDDRHNHATINFSSIAAGGATNQVPGRAEAKLDVRFTQDLSPDKIAEWMNEAEAAVPNVKAKVMLSGLPYEIKLGGPVARFHEIIKSVTGHYTTLSTAHGSSDARHFAYKGIPTINISSAGSGFHVPEEWVDLDDLALYYEVIRQFAEERAK